MPRLRWGLLGTARINRVIIPAIRGSSRSEVTAVASRTLDRARTYAAEWTIPRAIGSYQSLVDDPDVDVIYIGLPNSLHAEWTVRALEAGKHVLCEKPLALHVEDVDRITDAAGRTGRVAAEAFMYRHHPLTLAAERMVREGALGELRFIRGSFTYVLTTRGDDIRVDPALGGGSLWDVGCYPVSYACFIVGGAPLDVFGSQNAGPTGVDLAFHGTLRFGGGVAAQFDSGFNAHFRAEMEIVGTDAILRIDRPFRTGPASQLLLTREDKVEGVPFEPEPPYVGEVDDLAAAVLDGREPRVTLAESRRTVTVIRALYQSAIDARTVAIR